jgi:hypothetical protein
MDEYLKLMTMVLATLVTLLVFGVVIALFFILFKEIKEYYENY